MLTLSRGRLQTFLACQRKFQLRHVEQVAWPTLREAGESAELIAKGEQFHQLLHRHFLGMATPPEVLNELPEEVQGWWRTFAQHGPKLQAGQRPLPELTLTVGVGGLSLLARFDLLVVGEDFVRIYDWKTGKPRSETALRQDWQTRLYMALAVAGGQAFQRPHLAPEQVQMTYWYAQRPRESITLRYSTAEHERNWGEIQALVGQIEGQLDQTGRWPLTDNLATCQTCPYRTYCGRVELPALLAQIEAERREWDDEPEVVMELDV